MNKLDKLTNKYIGCLLGAAIGDALGKQNEGLERGDIFKRGFVTDYGKAPPGCPGEHLGAGEYTDDTEQMLLLALSHPCFAALCFGVWRRRHTPSRSPEA